MTTVMASRPLLLSSIKARHTLTDITAQNIRWLFAYQDMRRRELAEILRVSIATAGKVWNGHRRIGTDDLERLSTAFGISPDQFVIDHAGNGSWIYNNVKRK
ncbi:helix-turn-helix domain-containing protein [Leifsonia poae]|uniref:helix-turn-helix domain-containing protein n=1 Tax=Leifsonia poae TaxID=110933 RepID=UPI003D6767C1